MDPEPALCLAGVGKRYAPPPAPMAVDGIDLRVGNGEIFGLLGPNGAGKTTTVGIATTRVRPTCGSVSVAGIDVVEVSPPYDHAEITAYLAIRVCLEALSGMAAKKVGISHDPAGPLLEGR